MKCVLGTLQ